jgi:nucleoside-diphosphate-sugar epimerase
LLTDRLIIGCGYLGRRVAEGWRAQGHRVFATTRNAHRAAEWRQGGLEPLVCDVLDPTGLRQLPKAACVLYSVGFDRNAGSPMREVYVTGLANVLAALPARGRFLYVSSTGVYGQRGGEEVDETAATEPAEEAGRVVLAAESLVRRQLPGAVILRLAGIYGPGRLLRRQAVEAGEPLEGDPDSWLNLIHVEDGAAAVLAAEPRARPGEIYNVCDDGPVRRLDFYRLLARVLGAPEPCFVPSPDASSPESERANRRVSNRKMCRELKVMLRYPSYAEGLPASLANASG